MRRVVVLILFVILASNLFGATKDSGTSALKDIQPAGTTDKKHKNQQYDLSFVSTAGKEYTCRTSDKAKVKATDLPVNTSLTYEIKDNKGKVKTSAGKQFDCTVVRVAGAPATAKGAAPAVKQ